MTSAHQANTVHTYDEAFEKIASLIDAADTPVLVGIDGRSGSGKTYFAAELTSYLRPRKVASFEVEDFIGGWNELTRDIYNVAALAHTIRVNGRAVGRPWNWEANAWGRPTHVPAVPDADVVLVVGCGSTSQAMHSQLDVTVWIAVDHYERRARVEARDPYDWSEHWDTWAAQESILLSQYRSDLEADVIVRPEV